MASTDRNQTITSLLKYFISRKGKIVSIQEVCWRTLHLQCGPYTKALLLTEINYQRLQGQIFSFLPEYHLLLKGQDFFCFLWLIIHLGHHFHNGGFQRVLCIVESLVVLFIDDTPDILVQVIQNQENSEATSGWCEDSWYSWITWAVMGGSRVLLKHVRLLHYSHSLNQGLKKCIRSLDVGHGNASEDLPEGLGQHDMIILAHDSRGHHSQLVRGVCEATSVFTFVLFFWSWSKFFSSRKYPCIIEKEFTSSCQTYLRASYTTRHI